MRFKSFALVLCAFLSIQMLHSADSAESAESAESSKESPKFTKLFEDDSKLIEIELKSLSAVLDNKGEVLAGGIIKLTLKKPEDETAIFVNAVIAVCGYNGIMVIRSVQFDKNGKFLRNITTPVPLQNIKPNSSSGIVYAFLCSKAPAPTPIEPPSYKAPERYNKSWT